MFRNVLLGLDFSASADHALTEAIELGERHGGRLTIVTAIPEVRGWAAGPVESVTAANELNAQLEREAIALQHRALERVPACLPVATIIRRTTARRALMDALRDGCFDGVVIGGSRHGRLRCTRSLTRYLITHAGVPVLVADRESGASRLHVPGGATAPGDAPADDGTQAPPSAAPQPS
jgi:nucleotide-binding universal stress UspA family protein